MQAETRGIGVTSRNPHARGRAAKRGKRAFVQILGKLYFFQLLENLRLILFDYGQNRAVRANATFNAAC
jgi:hypothetical protein